MSLEGGKFDLNRKNIVLSCFLFYWSAGFPLPFIPLKSWLDSHRRIGFTIIPSPQIICLLIRQCIWLVGLKLQFGERTVILGLTHLQHPLSGPPDNWPWEKRVQKHKVSIDWKYYWKGSERGRFFNGQEFRRHEQFCDSTCRVRFQHQYKHQLLLPESRPEEGYLFQPKRRLSCHRHARRPTPRHQLSHKVAYKHFKRNYHVFKLQLSCLRCLRNSVFFQRIIRIWTYRSQYKLC